MPVKKKIDLQVVVIIESRKIVENNLCSLVENVTDLHEKLMAADDSNELH